jgi:hypothetical protein
VAALAADGSDNKDRIASTDGAVEALIRLAVEGGDKARACAAMAMANLVEDHVENKLFLASAPNCLQAVTALLRTGSEKARWHGARLVASMAMMPELRESIGAEKGALDELVRLCRSGGEDATCSAACALANLTDSHEANWERMARVHKGFSTLVNVAGGGGLEGRAHAVRALANLAVPYANKTLIAKTPRSLQVLVEALEMDRGATQSNAAAAIGNLAHDHSENKERIAQTPSALTALVASLHNGSDDCRRNSAAALSNICHEHAENVELLMRTAGSLQALVWCLCEARDDCRNNAACCIANLAASRCCVLMLLYYYIRVLILLYVCLHTTRYATTAATPPRAASPTSRRLQFTCFTQPLCAAASMRNQAAIASTRSPTALYLLY